MLDDKAQLEKGMQILGFENIPQIISKLLIYKELLIKWNKSYNLTTNFFNYVKKRFNFNF